MKRTLVLRLVLFIVVLAAASLACDLSGNNKTSKGERAFFNEMGFSFTPPAGTIVNDMGIFGADVSAAKVDKSGDFDLGPKCSASTGTSHRNLRNALRIYWVSAVASEKNNVGLDLSAYQETSVAGLYSVEGEETGNYLASIDSKLTPIYGKRLDVQLDGDQVFTLSCDGTVNRKAETLSLYDSLKGSVQFFAPITPTPLK
jgi:hypothetical protein